MRQKCIFFNDSADNTCLKSLSHWKSTVRLRQNAVDSGPHEATAYNLYGGFCDGLRATSRVTVSVGCERSLKAYKIYEHVFVSVFVAFDADLTRR